MYSVSNFCIEFDGKLILKKTSLNFERGKLYTIRGASGVGKSSLLNVIGMIAPNIEYVEYVFDGNKIDSRNSETISKFIAEEIAFIFQQQNLLRDVTVYENLAIPLRLLGLSENEIENRVETILQELEISDLICSYPTELSGGQEQRVAIARALVTEKTIILADEPTNSLDELNRAKVLSLLEEVAHKYHKIVLLVSHDSEVISMGDVRFNIENTELKGVEVNSYPSSESMQNSDVWESKKLSHSPKLRLKKKSLSLPKLLMFFVGFVVALSALSLNINTMLNGKYQEMVGGAFENSFLVINDSLGIKAKKVQDDLASFSEDIVEQIANSQNIETITPYMEFVHYGLTLENAKNYIETFKTYEATIFVDNQLINVSQPFSIQPLEKTNTTENYIEYFGDESTNGIFISESYLNNLGIQIRPGSNIKIAFYVPIALYDIVIEKDGAIQKSDGDLYVAVEKELPVSGLIKNNYPFHYSAYGQTFFMDGESMKNIQKDELNRISGELPSNLDGLSIRTWSTSAYTLVLKDNLFLKEELDRIKAISPQIITVSILEDYEQFLEGMSFIRRFLLIISGVLLILLAAILTFVFYLMNHARKLEVGILKALGLTTRQVVSVYFKELLLYGRRIIYYSAVLLLVFAGVLGNFLQIALEDLMIFTLTSLIYQIVLSFIIIIASGLLPIYTTCQKTIIDTIRLYR